MSTLKELYEISWALYDRIERGEGEDEWYKTDTHDVNVFVWGDEIKAVAYGLNEDMTTNYEQWDNLWRAVDRTFGH
jgi:hypothetical protein